MPPYAKHEGFVKTWPSQYEGWYTIWAMGAAIGAIYLTHRCEIGIGILRAFKGQGFGSAALAKLKELHRKPKYYANIAPYNKVSSKFFEKAGFKMLQRTYELEAK